MAKVQSTSVPTLLGPLWAKLTSPGKLASPSDGQLRFKKNKKKPNEQRKPDPDLIAFTRIAEIVATREGMTLGDGATTYFIFTLVRDLIKGIINPDYFRKCVVQSAVTMQSNCTSTEDQDPPPYGYRTALFMPTIPVYPNGTPSTDPAGYSGEKVGLFFEDTFLRWRKISYLAKNIDEPDLLDRVLMKWDCTITAGTSSRGSRPMFSLNVFGVWAKTGAAELTVNEPPIMKKTVLYWRFKIPASEPPFYNASQARSIMKPFSRIAKAQGSGSGVSLIVNAANRPMMGRGFNNNNIVQTAFVGDPELWEVKPPCKVQALILSNIWTWTDNDGKDWTCTLLNPRFLITTLHVGVFYTTVQVSDGATTYSVSVSQVMPGNWTWLYDYSGGDGDGALPKYETVKIINTSCDGDKMLMHIARSPLTYLKGARGFLMLEMLTPQTVQISTVADTYECNVEHAVNEFKDYGAAGLQAFSSDIRPQTIWCWFNGAGVVEKVQYHFRHEEEYITGIGFELYELGTKGDFDSLFLVDLLGNSESAAMLDGFDDSGRIKGWYNGSGTRDKSKTLIHTEPMWNSRFMTGASKDFYAAYAPILNENNHPWAQMSVEPVIVNHKEVRLSVKMYRLIYDGNPDADPFGSPPDYVLSDEYLGFKFTPKGITAITDHVTY